MAPTQPTPPPEPWLQPLGPQDTITCLNAYHPRGPPITQESVHLETGLSVLQAGTEGDSPSQGKAGGKSQLGRWGRSSRVEVVWSALNAWPNLAASHLGY